MSDIIAEVSDERFQSELQRRLSPPGRPLSATAAQLPAAGRTDTDLAELHQICQALDKSWSAVGVLPPAPPTWRGRLGQYLVRIVQRALFWYTPQITGFHALVTRGLQQILRASASANAETAELRSGLQSKASDTSVDAIRAELQNSSAAMERLSRRYAEVQDALCQAQTQINDLLQRTQRLPELAGAAERLRGLDGIPARVSAMEAAHHGIRKTVSAHDRRVSILLDQLRQSGAAQAPAPDGKDTLDELYTFFEDEFRGTRDEIKHRIEEYIGVILEAGAGTTERPVVDLGCGRGEWLEVLRDRGLTGRGIDTNHIMVERCRELGLDVMQADALSFLSQQPDASAGAITGFHIIEHLPFRAFIAMLDEIVRVLQPGGVAVLETPDPSNVQVGSHFFYLDPTHRNPIPTVVTQFFMEQRGLSRIEIRPLHPYPEALRIPDDGTLITRRFNEFFFGSQDYAAIGWKL